MTNNEDRPLPNRREFFTIAWFGALALAFLQFGKATLKTAKPHGLGSLLGGVISFGPLSAAPAVGDPPIDDPENRTWLVNTENGLLALDKTCTHLDCLLAWDSQDREFYCPCHGSRFTLEGEYLAGPAPRGMDRYVVQLVGEDEAILASTNTASGEPLVVAYGGGDGESAEVYEVVSEEEDEPSGDVEVSSEIAQLSADDILIQVDKSHRILGAQSL